MKILHFYLFILPGLFLAAFFTSCDSSLKITEYPNGISIDSDSGKLQVQFCNSKIIHVTYRPSISFGETSPLMIEKRSVPAIKVDITREKGLIILDAGATKVKININTNNVSFYDTNWNLLLGANHPQLKKVDVPRDSGYTIRQYFSWKQEEALFGLGQQQCGTMNWRGKSVELFQQNKFIAIPSILSSEGYGLLWNNYSYSRFNDTPEGSFLQSELADQIDYFIVAGPLPDSIIAGFRFLTGDVPMLPKWAFGYIQSKERYKTQEELLSVVKEYRKRHIPIDGIVLDWRYWKGDEWGQKSFDEARFPNPVAMMNSLHNDLNVHLMISVWPKLGATAQDFIEMKKHPGFLYTDSTQQSIYDAFNPEARKLFWDQANRGLFSKGIDAWWCDATEPELMGWNWDLDNYRKIMKPSIGSGTRYMNAYSLMQSKGMYENQRQTTRDKRVFILTRSAYPAIQKYGAATWSGDIDGTCDVFRKQIPAGLNFCMSGIPYWTTDIGGFFVNSIDNFKPDRIDPPIITDENYKRLYVRWFQYGVFCPLFRSHGTDLPRELWRFGEPGSWAYDALVKATKLRYQLLPYIYSNVWRITSNNYTLMRALVFDFPNDTSVYRIPDQFMFGPAILVNPITDSLAVSRKVYLPKTKWYDFWTGDTIQGGQWITTAAPISRIPLFVKAGSIIPVSPDIHYANEITDKPVTIWIFPGADAKFDLYEDEGDNYNYEKGLRSLISMKWNEAEKKLDISKIEGNYPGMARKKLFQIIIATKGKTISNLNSEPDKIQEYNGEAVSVILK